MIADRQRLWGSLGVNHRGVLSAKITITHDRIPLPFEFFLFVCGARLENQLYVLWFSAWTIMIELEIEIYRETKNLIEGSDEIIMLFFFRRIRRLINYEIFFRCRDRGVYIVYIVLTKIY